MKKLLLILGIFSIWQVSSAEKTTDLGNHAATAAVQVKKTDVGNCSPSTTQQDLDINNVRARLLGGGDFWWDGVDNAVYEVPKVDQSSNQISISAIFTGALWFSGEDDAGNLKVAAQTYRNQGHDFWTGPLDLLGEVDFEACNAFDDHFVVYGAEIDAFLGLYLEQNGAISNGQIADNILNWPGRGNPNLAGTARFYDDGKMAPFFDNNSDGIYNPTDGDYPVIGATTTNILTSEVEVVGTFADMMVFWVINDNGQVHGRTGGEAIGVQVNCLAFAYQTSNALNDMTFYTFDIVKKSPGNLLETYMGVFVDPDLGTFSDDFIGCDVDRALGFVYNANAIDQLYGAPPIMGIDYFEGPTADDGTELGMSSFVYFTNGNGPQSDPDVAAEFRNYQTGFWADGAPIVFGGNGRGVAGAPATNYCYPGNPALCGVPGEWSECNADDAVTGGCVAQAPDDRRFVQNSGPFTLSPGEFQKITIGVIWVLPDNYTGCPDIDLEIGAADDLAQSLFDNNFQLIDGPDAPTLAIRELENELIISLNNNPGSNNFGEAYSQRAAVPDNGTVYPDSLYLFQGYKVFQLENSQVSAQDLDDPALAQLIFQVDIKDDVADVYNFEASPTGFYNSVIQVEGSNQGITRSFRVTEDIFAEGDRGLVNNKVYYFAAVAYAYNNYIPFEFPIPTPMPQFEPYLQGRKNFKQYNAVPHVIDGRNGGTVLNTEYGQSLSVQRLEGRGNGGVPIRLDRETEEAIVNSSLGFQDILTYELGMDPLNVIIVDPLKVQNVDFELSIKGRTEAGIDTPFIDNNAIWQVLVFRDGQVIDTINSDRTIDRQYEQILEDYGVSLSVGLALEYNTNLVNGATVYQPTTSSTEFEDIGNLWLSYIQDAGFSTANNWIRSGVETNPASEPYLNFVYDSHQYDDQGGATGNEFYDPEALFEGILDGGMAPYCLASNYSNPLVTATGEDLEPNFLHGPAFRTDRYDVPGTTTEVENPVNTLENLSSVEIVITPDSDLWSRCIVFETGEDYILNEGGAPKGGLRAGTSLDFQGNPQANEGQSWFPGYAINTETGERLNISFGESSSYGDNNGADMYWNPTAKIADALTVISGTSENVPVWGGKHFIYVWSTLYDDGRAAYDILDANPIDPTPGAFIPAAVADLYQDIMYAGIPVLTPGSDPILLDGTRLVIPSEVRISINHDQPFDAFGTSESTGTASNDSLPRYGFSTVGLAPEENVTDVAASALDNIRVVPNPYYAFSAYEESQIDNVVKLTNLPDRCVVSIFSLDGKLVRRFDRAVGTSATTTSARQEISSGQEVGSINIDNSINWDLNNSQRIPVGSGTYLIHVDAFDLGETVKKAVVFLRPTDVSNF